ncbi:unnamed protein product [Nezara viridula]|uniref:Peptidase S1 domain-containing protein n=1 Tax=Nezara viridula TaxID=85310 RepID=A0A9P0E5S0_NEZVI|nr:unnamed protein product [Nezara viridula]
MNRLVQVALVSMGKGCARYGVPAVNTALFPYLGWMQWTIQRSMRRHFFKIITEALFAWILLFGTGSFLYCPKRVSASYPTGDDVFAEEEEAPQSVPLKFRNINRNVMTCNCSWGTVLYKTHQKRKIRNENSFGGRPISEKERYPMMAGLQTENGCMVCAATILTEYHALTTAQCVQDNPKLTLAVGWGKLSTNTESSPSLIKLFLEAVEPELCKKQLGGNVIINQHLRLCTTANRKAGCAGDSGSPLFMVDQSVNRIVQVAIMTKGTLCGRTDRPATSVAIHPYLGWIQWNVEKSLKRHHPNDYRRCDSSFCYITAPNVN